MKKVFFYLQALHSLGFLFGIWNLLIFSSFQAVNSVLRENFCYFLTWELDALKSHLPYSTEFRLQKWKTMQYSMLAPLSTISRNPGNKDFSFCLQAVTTAEDWSSVTGWAWQHYLYQHYCLTKYSVIWPEYKSWALPAACLIVLAILSSAKQCSFFFFSKLVNI